MCRAVPEVRDRALLALYGLDEETPHRHVVIVPIVVKTLKGKEVPEERLCARAITGGRYRLSKLQDEYAAAAAHLGIERGVKGAQIEYDHLHRRYADTTGTPPPAEESVEAIAVHPPPPGTPQQLRAHAEAEQARIRRAVRAKAVALAARCEELERRARDEGKRLAALQAALREAEAQAATGRRVDLGWLLGQPGGIRERHDPHLWRLGGGTIAVDGQRFRDLTRRHEGSGAVELLAHATGCDYRAADACMAAAADQAARRAAPMAERALNSPAVELAPLRAKEKPAHVQGRPRLRMRRCGPGRPSRARNRPARPGHSRGGGTIGGHGAGERPVPCAPAPRPAAARRSRCSLSARGGARHAQRNAPPAGVSTPGGA